MDYYKHHFPYDEVFRFATIHQRDPETREFAVTTAGDVWRRYQSAGNGQQLKKLLAKAGAGATLHLGPFYSEASHRARVPGVVAVGKQLCFDLDLQDISFLDVPRDDQAQNDRYVRCLFAQVHVLQAILTECFGFEHFLPVYSGRRGIHLWVLDLRATLLPDAARKAICAMITPPNNKNARRAIEKNPNFNGELVRRAVAEARDRVVLESVANGGIGLFDSKISIEGFLRKLFDGVDDAWEGGVVVQSMVRTAASDAKRDEKNVYAAIVETLAHGAKVDEGKKLNALNVSCRKMLNKLDDVVFTLVWPTLDAAATGLGHCVKSPFSLHGSTGRVSIPIKDPLVAIVPIVRGDGLADGAQKRIFHLAIAQMRDVVSSAARAAASSGDGDIEDIVSAPKKRRVA